MVWEPHPWLSCVVWGPGLGGLPMQGPHLGQVLPCCPEAGVGEKVAQYAHRVASPLVGRLWGPESRSSGRWQAPKRAKVLAGGPACTGYPRTQVWATSHPTLPGTLQDRVGSERIQNQVPQQGCGFRVPGPPPRPGLPWAVPAGDTTYRAWLNPHRLTGGHRPDPGAASCKKAGYLPRVSAPSWGRFTPQQPPPPGTLSLSETERTLCLKWK